MVDCLEQFRRDIGVKTHTMAQPSAECQEHLYHVNHRSLFVELFNCGGELDKFVGAGGCLLRRGVVRQVLQKHIDTFKNLVHKFLARDVHGGSGLFPVAFAYPFRYCLGRDTDLFGDGLLRLPLHVQEPRVLALLLTFLFSGHL